MTPNGNLLHETIDHIEHIVHTMKRGENLMACRGRISSKSVQESHIHTKYVFVLCSYRLAFCSQTIIFILIHYIDC